MNNFDERFQSESEKNTNKIGNNAKKMTEKQIKDYIGFTKFKSRLLTIRLVKSLLAMVGFAFIACGVTLILTKLEVLPISPWFSLLFMLFGGGIAFVCVFFPLSITDKRLAYRLDEEFSLKERVQTSLANMKNNSAMSLLLRRDLKDVTSKIAAKKIKARGLPVYIIVAAIGLATLITGLAIRQDKPEPTPPPPAPPVSTVWELTEEQAIALEDFAISVEESNMVSPAKEEIATKIRDLLEQLKQTGDEDIAYDLINACVEGIDEITYKTGSRGAIYDALKSKETVFSRELARALTRQELEVYLAKMYDALDSLKHKNDQLEEPTEEQQDVMKAETLALLHYASKDVLDALNESGVDPSDELYKLISQLVTLDENDVYGIDGIASMLEFLAYRVASIKIDDLKDTMLVKQNIYLELDRQNQNYNVGYGASDGIRELFGLAVPQREDTSKEPEEEDENNADEDQQKPSDGGFGEGLVLGTDELIYDKENGQTIITLEIYQIYEETMYTHFGVDTNGDGVKDTLPPEMQKYLDLLLKGYKEGEK